MLEIVEVITDLLQLSLFVSLLVFAVLAVMDLRKRPDEARQRVRSDESELTRKGRPE